MGRLALREDVAGVDVGDDYVALARIRRKGARWSVTHAATTPCDTAAAPEAVAGVVRGLARKVGLSTRTTASSLHSRSLLYRYCRFPGIGEPDEIRAAMRIEAEEALQLPPDEIVTAWQPLGGAQEGAPAAEGILVAVPERDVVRHVRILQLAGLYPAMLDVRCMALANLYRSVRPAVADDREGDRIVCLTHMSASSADTAILYGGDRVYARSVHFRAGANAEDRTAYLLGSLQDVLKYFRFKLHNRPVDELVMMGRVPDPARLCERATAACGVPTSLWDPAADLGLPTGRRGGGADPALLCVALGLALWGEDDA